VILKFFVPSFFVFAMPVFATASNIYNKYYNNDEFSFDGRRFNGISNEIVPTATYEHIDPDHKFLRYETKNSKYGFDWKHEFVSADKNKVKERISRLTEVSSSGIGDNRVVTASTATFYNNNKLRARTVCSGDVSEQIHCVTATQKSCLGVMEKYKEVTQASKEKSALLSNDPAENEKNIKTCQNLMQGYAEVAGASSKYMKTHHGYDEVARVDSEAIQNQADLVFGKKKVLFSNINANPAKLGDITAVSRQAQASARLLSSPTGIELVHKLVQACRQSQQDFDTSRLDGEAAKGATGNAKTSTGTD